MVARFVKTSPGETLFRGILKAILSFTFRSLAIGGMCSILLDFRGFFRLQ